MMKTGKKEIGSFLASRRLAIAGVSRNTKKFGGAVYTGLKEKGYEVLPVNPNVSEIDGTFCYKSVSDLPDDVESLLIVTPRNQTDTVLKEAFLKGIKNIWVQQFSETEHTVKIAEEYRKEIILHKCIFMFADPVAGIHRFHRTLVKLFGGLPK